MTDTFNRLWAMVDRIEALEKERDDLANENAFLRAQLEAADALADPMGEALPDLVAHGGYSYEDDFVPIYRAKGPGEGDDN